MIANVYAMNVYINLPVADLERSRAFFAALGFAFDDDFSDEATLGMELNGNCYCMFVTPERFSTFTPRPLADAREATEVLVSLQLESREEVDGFMDTALGHGADEPREPMDYGFMYARAFADPDGHIWEPFWLDLEAALAAGPVDVGDNGAS
ncbi:VOC family protein [Candidatus Palauibacter soopunensis]|uniref:VOC family protein n=1 Tax=Candidatus Palauibacter soopunensis TaxID=3056739 RepID=UPI0023A2341E|nr:VOC family protein [Candidatus Palauibacter soopunensis]MDE2877343.1 VOC family protein [Candidatus Palauibacter soopunensis]